MNHPWASTWWNSKLSTTRLLRRSGSPNSLSCSPRPSLLPPQQAQDPVAVRQPPPPPGPAASPTPTTSRPPPSASCGSGSKEILAGCALNVYTLGPELNLHLLRHRRATPEVELRQLRARRRYRAQPLVRRRATPEAELHQYRGGCAAAARTLAATMLVELQYGTDVVLHLLGLATTGTPWS
jgi:hypothetical protein